MGEERYRSPTFRHPGFWPESFGFARSSSVQAAINANRQEPQPQIAAGSGSAIGSISSGLGSLQDMTQRLRSMTGSAPVQSSGQVEDGKNETTPSKVKH